MRYFIEFSYNGKPFFGYQIQPNKITIQGQLENALSIILKEKIKITGAGRTDTGVHAKQMFAHFDTCQVIDENLSKKLNSFLSSDIAILRIFNVKETLHARFDAICRTYEYYISTEKNPFSKEFTWQIWRKKLNLESMNEASKLLLEYEDFTSFAKLHTDNKTNICKIYKAEWKKNENNMIFTISANRFLRNMVRAIVGTIVEIGLGKMSPTDLHKIIQTKNRNSAAASAPAHGLFLASVEYKF